MSHRQGEIVVLTEPGATVRIEQRRHVFRFGTAVSSKAFNGRMTNDDRAHYLRTLRENFNFAVHENALKWHATQPEQDQISYETADAVLAWCAENGLGMRGHTIFWAKPWRVQPWVKALDDAALRQTLEARATALVERYRGQITDFDVNNEMIDGHYFEERLGDGIRAQLFRWAHEANPDAVLYVNEPDILTGVKLDAYIRLVEELIAAGAPVGGLGVQGHFETEPDIAVMREALNRLAAFGLPITITEFDVLTADEAVKANTLEDVYRAAFAHPAVDGILMWGFWGNAHWLNSDNAVPGYTALWDAQWSPTPAAEAYRRLVFDEWWTRVEGVADAEGVFRARVFLGEHDVCIGERAVATVRVTQPKTPVEVALRPPSATKGS